MRRRVLAPLVLVPALLTCAPADAAGCRHLLDDPRGDATHFGNHVPYPSAIDDPSQVDVRWAELRTTSREIVATIKLVDLEPEGPRNLSHAYSMTFTTDGQEVELIAYFDQQHLLRAEADVAEVGSGYPDDGGAYVGRRLGDIRATRDLAKDLVVLRADRSLLGGVQTAVTGIGATGWGETDYPLLGKPSTYGVADRALTSRTFRSGQRDCLT